MIDHNQRPGFTFKQFHVAHDQCAMKVGTDGILLAAWLNLANAKRILDVGTGTGLISLIMAQRCQGRARIDAIDIEPDAVEQAKLNVANSPWPNAIQVALSSMQDYQAAHSYDLIVSNPPYFPAGQSFEQKRQQARHNGSLDAQQFFLSLTELSHSNTELALVLPCDVAEHWQQHALRNNWYLIQQADVQSVTSKPAIRSLLRFSKLQLQPVKKEQILIYQADNAYSKQYVELCRDLYLKM
ncbi:tRNA1(Val) (adenine(37)-N6)-methyltransferase [Agarivorans sp. Alg241-V36]|uniref:tRNA1(Val) (adenine(37)-N6)-methyltransferase n=1 Tax=Agarivorans sp. Alg241-V36 TaxID=2305992 RepID=UPI0013D26A4D|nr:methyltransferase [Agarivorans sp. Alg241-V36]